MPDCKCNKEISESIMLLAEKKHAINDGTLSKEWLDGYEKGFIDCMMVVQESIKKKGENSCHCQST
jgi:hypothetical protein